MQRTRPRVGRLWWLLLFVVLLPMAPACQESSTKRDAWNRPEQVLEALGIGTGQTVADIGSGSGYFTFHLARRVGPNGKVYAVDIDDGELKKVRRRADNEGLAQVETVLSTPNDPRLPTESLDAALIMNAYHEFREPDAMLRGLYQALKPGGVLGIIEGEAEPGKKRKSYYSRHALPADVVREEAARNGFQFLRREPGFERPRGRKNFYFLVFLRPAP